MKIKATEEAAKMIFPLIIQKTPLTPEEFIYTNPVEMLQWMQTLDNKVTFFKKKHSTWKGIALGLGVGLAYHIWKEKKLEDMNKTLKEELDERES